MATPIVHISAGVIIASIYCLSIRHMRDVDPKQWCSLMLPVMIFSCLPDVDLVYSYLFTGRVTDLHFGITHTVFFAALVACLVRISTIFSMAKYSALIFLLVLSHVVIDGLTGPSRGYSEAVGIAALAPFYDGILVSPITLFKGVNHAEWFSYQNLKTVLSDLFIVPLACFFFTAVSIYSTKKLK